MTLYILGWIIFNVFIITMLLIDLFIVHRDSHVVKYKEALAWSAFWILLALAFCGVLFYTHGSEKALQFLAGYLIEKSLSVDNLFVFLVIFSYFKVPEIYRHKVLFWGIVGALVMRAIFIFSGVILIQSFHWMIYVFGALLIVTGIKLGLEKEKEIHPENNLVIKLFCRFFPVTDTYENGHFFVKRDYRYWATPLFIVLLVIETTDILFAIDSVPAILAITQDPFIVYTSNVLAIMGLRSIYFALAGLMEAFHFLHYGLALLLIFIGTKMLLSDYIKIPITLALGIIAIILIGSVILSFVFKKPETKN